MKKFFITAFDNLDRPVACATFETQRECIQWYNAEHDNGGCKCKVRFANKIKLSNITGFEENEYMRLSSRRNIA